VFKLTKVFKWKDEDGEEAYQKELELCEYAAGEIFGLEVLDQVAYLCSVYCKSVAGLVYRIRK
jgi:hypothetical protein